MKKIYSLKDAKGRDLLIINDKGDVVLGRYPDLTKKEKEKFIDFYEEIGGEFDKQELINFLNYEDDNDLFCS